MPMRKAALKLTPINCEAVTASRGCVKSPSAFFPNQ